MANVLNPETESITLNTELETPTLEPATELVQPPCESTSNPETAAVVEVPALDADALTEPVAEAAPVEEAAIAEPAVEASPVAEAVAVAEPVVEAAAETAPVAEPVAEVATQAEPVAAAPAHEKAHEHGLESMDDFSAALAAFER